jgi:triosephosphate isomerase (TIM)
MTRIIAGNWKMHHGPSAARDFLLSFERSPEARDVRLVLFPPAVSLSACLEAANEAQGLEFGVQNLHPEPSGAFTGELSAEMAADAGATLALVGHSERRHVFGETDEEARLKVEATYRAGLTPVLCVGETLPERQDGRLQEVILRQLHSVVADESLGGRIAGGAPFMLAYEPVWAIGTGETATPEDAAQAHGMLRGSLRERLGEDTAAGIPILYGGSVKAENAAALLAASDVDGVLVGGASLDPDSFGAIAAAAG